jgi:VWFA-related protein
LLRLLVWGLMAGMASAGQTTATDAAVGVNSEGLIGLDAVVVDATGQPVAGLRREDFAVLDDGIPRPVVSFSAHDGGSAKSDSQVQLILLVDTFGETDEVAEQERSATEQFLREHNGQLEMPTTVYALAGLKFWRVAGPSLDGAALASALGQNRMAGDNLLSGGAFAVNGPPGSLGLYGGGHGPAIHAPDANLGIFALGWIAAQARTQPGRKVLLWVGPGSIRESIRRISFYQSDGTRQSFARRGWQ